MTATAPPPTKTVTPTIDGREPTVAEGTATWDAAKGAGIDIPPHGRAAPGPDGGASP